MDDNSKLMDKFETSGKETKDLHANSERKARYIVWALSAMSGKHCEWLNLKFLRMLFERLKKSILTLVLPLDL